MGTKCGYKIGYKIFCSRCSGPLCGYKIRHYIFVPIFVPAFCTHICTRQIGSSGGSSIGSFIHPLVLPYPAILIGAVALRHPLHLSISLLICCGVYFLISGCGNSSLISATHTRSRFITPSASSGSPYLKNAARLATAQLPQSVGNGISNYSCKGAKSGSPSATL